MIAIIASNLGQDHVALVAMALAGALAGFLVYNLPPASIYLGDSGSMVIGLVVGILGMQAALKTPTTLAITAPAVLMSIPMLDTVLAIVRRKLSGQRFYTADRGHIHHRLLERGLNNWQALGIIGLLCLMTGGAAAAAIVLRSDGLAWAMAISIVVLMIRMRVFGHHELSLVKVKLAASLVRLVDSLLNSTRKRPYPNVSPEPVAFEQAWQTLVDEARKWSLDGVHIAVGRGSHCHARHAWNKSNEDSGPKWSLSLTFRQPDDRYCHLQVFGGEAMSANHPLLPRATRILTTFGQYWSAWPESRRLQPVALGQSRKGFAAGF
jgi:UDP-GlcNAc:undecaprenyl-phosphate GlcNAc-1-phosphate transferase